MPEQRVNDDLWNGIAAALDTKDVDVVASVIDGLEVLWGALEEHGMVDSFGGAESTRVAPVVLQLLHKLSNQGPVEKKYLGVAQIVVPGAGAPGAHADALNPYAACPMYTDNWGLLERWLRQNYNTLASEALAD